MKHKEFAILLIVILFGCKTNDNLYPIENGKLYPIGKNGIWGFANEDGKVEIPYQFEKVTFFNGGRASVKQGGKFGFINKKGKYLIKTKYDSIGYFSHEKANVVKKGKKLTIDRDGNKLNEGILITTCGTGIEYASDPNEFFEKVDNKYILNKKDFENHRRLDTTADFKLSDFIFDEVIPFSSKSVIVKKNNKFDIYVHFNSVGLKGVWVDEIIPNFSNKTESKKLIQANNAKYKVGEKLGLISDLGHVELEPEFLDIEKYSGIVQYIIVKSINCDKCSRSNNCVK